MASLELPFGIRPLNPVPVDAYYYNTSDAPYTNTAQAVAQVVSAVRYQGLTVNIAGVEYWWAAGITDGDLVVKGGGSSAGVSILHTDLNTVGNVGGAETTLLSYAIPANTLGANNQSLKISSAGLIVGNADTKRLRIKLAGTVILDTDDFAAFTDSDFVLDCQIVREGANAQRCWGRIVSNIGGFAFAKYTPLTKDLTTGLTLTITGEAATTDDMTVDMTQILIEK